MAGLAPEAAAAQEAWEEAGVTGSVNPVCLGRFGYMKCLTAEATVPCAVAVYGLRVAEIAKKYPEMKERDRQWFTLVTAAALVEEAELQRLIAGFVPPAEGRAEPIGVEGEQEIPPKRRAKPKR
jgi:8-oxo-dGTP pyrophosphatase MutT (NUDIX family)